MEGFRKERGCWVSDLAVVAPVGAGWLAVLRPTRNDPKWQVGEGRTPNEAYHAMHRRLPRDPQPLPEGKRLSAGGLHVEIERRGLSIPLAYAMTGNSPTKNAFLYQVLAGERKPSDDLARRLYAVFGDAVLEDANV